MKEILSIKNLSHSYHSNDGETPAIDHLSLSVSEGEFVSIVGPSGCGKSTLLSLIAGLYSPQTGTLSINGNVGYMLQKDHLLEHRTIYKNILLGLEIQKKLTNDNLARVETMLSEYGLEDFRNAYPRQLSGGMRQRAALIRTLALSPSLLLLDEPFSALDYQTRLKVSNDIGSIIKKQPVSCTNNKTYNKFWK